MVINHLSPVVMTIYWMLFFAFLDGFHSTCVFDAIKSSDVAITQVNYTLRREPGFAEDARLRRKRDISIDDFFMPIRLSTFFFKMELDDSEKEKLKSIISRAVSLIENMLSVLPVEGPLLLNRTGCKLILVEGINGGKCHAAVRNYRGEFCSDLQIPDDHLDGFSLWSSFDPVPTSVLYNRGDGVDNTDLILYVQSFASSQCTAGELNVIAYATYCRLDQNGRPVAGYINICPEMMRQNDFNEEKVFLTVLHELFHALGFSSDLFDSFKECSLTGNFSITCRPLRPVRWVRGASRLVTKRVVELTSKHFGCNGLGGDFGPILQTDDSGKVKSHWDAVFMQSSLMTPTISQPHMTFLDPITLAVFEDSGWYRVNYAHVQEYYWGKGQGCDFGLSSSCLMPDSAYFCQQQSSPGCHFLHKDRGTCLSSPFLHGCSFYDSHLNDSCNPPPGFSTSDGFDESFGENSRCFLSNLTQVTGDELSSSTADLDLIGRCYTYSCNATGHVHVKVQDKWSHCPEGLFIEIPGLNGVVKCPASEILCSDFRPLFNVSMEGTPNGIPSNRNRFTTPYYYENHLEVDITFESLPTFAQGRSQLTQMLHDVVISAILSNTNISVGRIGNMEVLWSLDIVQFVLKKPVKNCVDDSSHFMETLSKVIDAGNFSVSFFRSVYRATAVSYRQMSSHATTPHHRELSTAVNTVLHSLPSHSGIILVITVVSIIAIVILLVVVILVFRYCCLTRRSKGSQNRPVDSVISAA